MVRLLQAGQLPKRLQAWCNRDKPSISENCFREFLSKRDPVPAARISISTDICVLDLFICVYQAVSNKGATTKNECYAVHAGQRVILQEKAGLIRMRHTPFG